jgi:hypothetical protein
MDKPSNRDISKVMAELGKRGGAASAKNLTAKQRSERAKKAVTAREAKRAKKVGKK